MSILSQIIAYSPNKIDTETKARSLVQGPRNMYAGERIGFYEGKLVTEGPNKGKYAVYNVPESVSKTRIKYFPNEKSVNKWIESRPGQGRKDFGKFETGSRFKGTIQKHNLEKVKKLEEVVTKSNSQYKKSLSSKAALEAVGFKDGYQAIQSKGALRDAVKEKLSKLLTTQQKIDNYVNNVMLAEDALVKDFKNPISHIAKKFGVSRVTVGNWARDSQVYQNNKNIFTGLSKELNYNKYKFVGDGVPRLMSDYSVIMQNKLPTSLTMYGGDQPSNFIMQSAYRNYIQNKTAGKNAKVTFVGNPELLPQNEWQFIKGNKLYSLDPSVDEIEFNGKTYKNNYLARGDAKTLYANDFGNIYKKFDNLDKYMNTFVPDPNNPGKEIRLDTLLRQKAFNETGKKNFLKRRFVELDHMDILNDPFGNSGENSIRLLDRQTNVRAGIVKRLDKYKNNPKLLNKYLTDIGYFNVDKTNDAFIKRIAKTVSTSSKNEITNSMLEFAGTITDKCKVGNAEGGRIGFASGSADCLRIAKEGLEEGLKTGFKKGNQQVLAEGILKSGKFLKDAVSLRGLFGPLALGFTVAAEAGLVGYDMLSSGKSFREAVGDSVFNYALGDKTKIDSEEEIIKRLQNIKTGPQNYQRMGDEEIGKMQYFKENLKDLGTGFDLYNKLGAIQKNRDAISMSPEDAFNKGAFQLDLDKQEDAVRADIRDYNKTGTPNRVTDYLLSDAAKEGADATALANLLVEQDRLQDAGIGNIYQSRKGDEKRIQRGKEIGYEIENLLNPNKLDEFGEYFISRPKSEQSKIMSYGYREGGIASLNVKK